MALSAKSPGPIVAPLDDSSKETFATGRPLEDSPELQQCKHCKKSILKVAAKAHVAQCLKLKKERAQKKKEAREARVRAQEQAQADDKKDDKADAKADDDSDSEDEVLANKKATGLAKAGPASKKATTKKNEADDKTKDKGKEKEKEAEKDKDKNKKRKAEAEAEKAPKPKKKKEEPKPKMVKPKGKSPRPKTPIPCGSTISLIQALTVAELATGPVDVEKQCGVLLPNGMPCARSLTCKSHSMGAKRAVAGRSLPYDMLLAAYQKKNQAKQQSKFFRLRPWRQQIILVAASDRFLRFFCAEAALDANAPPEDDDEQNAGPVDSDEETAAVMGALSHWNPQPVLPQPIFMPIKRQYQLARLHEQLQTATNGGRTNIFRVVGFGAQKLPEGHISLYDNEDAPGEPDSALFSALDSRRSSSFGIPGPPGPPRRQSVTTR